MDQTTVTVPEGFEDLLTRPLIGHLATVGEGGTVMSNPMWFDWDGRRLRFTHTKVRQKFKNLHHEPRLALSIVDPNDDQRYVEVRGVVEQIVDDPGAAFYQRLREKYGRTSAPIRDADVRVVVVVRPTAIFGRAGATAERPPTIVRGKRVPT